MQENNKVISICKRLLKEYGIFIAIAIGWLLYIFLNEDVVLYTDSQSYMKIDSWALLTQGKITIGYAPLYGIFLDFLQWLTNEKIYLLLCVAIQFTLSFVAVVLIYKMLKEITDVYISSVLIFLYSISPMVLAWNNCILTESLSISGITFFIYFAFRFFGKPSVKDGSLVVIISVILPFLRPQFLILTALAFTFLIVEILTNSNRKICLCLLLEIIIGCIPILIYCQLFKAYSDGIFSITAASMTQQLFLCIQRGYISSPKYEEVMQKISELKLTYSELGYYDMCCNVMWDLERFYGDGYLKGFVDDCIHNNLQTFLIDTFHVMQNNLLIQIKGYGIIIKREQFEIIEKVWLGIYRWMCVGTLELVSLVGGVNALYSWIKNKRIPWNHMLLFGIMLGFIYPTFFLTFNEYMRTMVECVPCVVVIAGYCCSAIRHRR